MFKIAKKVAIAGSVAAISWNVFITTVQDDWDTVRYNLKQLTLLKVIEKTMVPPSYRYPKKVDKSRKKVVVLGSGWAAMSFLQQVDIDKFDITVVSPRPYFFYTPLLAQTATGTVSNAAIKEPIRSFCNKHKDVHAGSYLQAKLNSVDAKKKVITCSDVQGHNIDLTYDHLIVAVGCDVATFNIPGVKEYAINMKELEDGAKVQRKILQSLEAANAAYVAGAPASEIDKMLHWVIVGGGPTGVELSAEITDFLKEVMRKQFPHLEKRVKVTILEGLDRLLVMFDKQLAEYAGDALKAQGISLGLNTFVTKIEDGFVHVTGKLDPIPSNTSPNSPYKLIPAWTSKIPFQDFTIDKSGSKFSMKIPMGLIVWAGGITPREVTKSLMGQFEGQQSRFGLQVDKKLRVLGAEDSSMFAIGDCAVSGDPPTAQAASQQGVYLGRMLRDTGLKSSEVIESYPDYKYDYKGSMAYVGSQKGVAQLNISQLKKIWNFSKDEKSGQFTIEGNSAFTLWSSLYFTKLLSNKNRYQVGVEWLRTGIFGRDIAATEFQESFAKSSGKEK